MARPPKYRFDKSFFDDIDSDEKAYWLGFVAADGCVTERSLIVTLSSRDLGHLGALKAALKADYPIKTKPNPQGGESATLCVNSTEFVAKLGHHNIVPRKTFIFAMPRMRADLVGSFVRGVFDGDGCVHRGISRSGNPFYVVQIAGTLMLMEQIQQHCRQRGIDHTTIQPHRKQPKTHVLHISKIISVCAFRDWIYAHATVFLKRKKAIFDKAKVLPDRECPVCGHHFTPRYRNKGRYCSHKCYLKDYYRDHPEKWKHPDGSWR